MSGDRLWRIRWLEDQHYNEDSNEMNDDQEDDKNKRHKQNTISDYMDELDHEEWGGPKGVSTNFDSKNNGSNSSINNNNGSIPGSMHNELVDILINPIIGTIGKRLLYKIGYIDKKNNDSTKQGYHQHLPSIKTNVYGVGYDPYINATEFKNELLERKHRASQRWETNEYVDIAQNNNSMVEVSRDDFIGYRTSTGFAINDDMDDVYDDHINDKKEFYLNDNEDHITNNFKDGNNNSKAITDNNAPIPSFCKSTTTSSSIHLFQPIRYSGPLPPSSYNEHQFILPNINAPSNSLSSNNPPIIPQLNKHKSKFASTLSSLVKQNSHDKSQPMTGSNFANIAILMNNRFTSSSSTKTTSSSTIGLSKPTKYKSEQCSKPASKQPQRIVPKRISIQKNMHTWIPSSLLCKRFHVVPSEHIQTFQQTDANGSSSGIIPTPSEFDHHFSTHILPKVNTTANATYNNNDNDNNNAATTESTQSSSKQNNSMNASDDYNAALPSKETFKSIYESLSSDDENESKNDHHNTITTTPSKSINNPQNGNHHHHIANTTTFSSTNNTESKEKIIKENKYDSTNDNHSIASSSTASTSSKKRKGSRKKERRKKSHKRKKLHNKDEKHSKRHHHRSSSSKKHKRKKII